MDLAPTALRGSYPPLVTPFRDGAVDLDTFAELVEFQIAAGSRGVVVAGTTGEPSVLTLEERKALASVAIATAGGRIPVVVATGSQSHAETVELTRHADAGGADAVLVVTPYYIRPPEDGLVAYYVDVCRRTERPVLVYHIPGRAGVGVTVGTLERIAEAAPNLVGMKHAANDLGLVSDVLRSFGPDFRLFVGLEELSFPMLALGAAGMVNAVANVAPQLVSALYDAVAAGDLAEARSLHFELLELNRAVFWDTNPIPIKHLMVRLGLLPVNEHRLPMRPAGAELVARLDALLERSSWTAGIAR